jgi:serine/threonine-protein kinase PknG
LTIAEEQRVCYNPECKWLGDKAHNAPPGTAPNPKNPQGLPRNLYRVRQDGSVIDKGKCPSCQSQFNFAAIETKSMIGQYEIVGPVAIGGCGFIYLAYDTAVGRYVILKGLLNSRDPEQQQNAVVERGFLAGLQDSHIVQCMNFVTHIEPETEETQTYIVMEFIDGQTLKQIKKSYMKDHNSEPLPLTEAIYYILGILPAFSYLHRKGVIYCDFKMDNAMVQGERLRLIDLGGARKADDTSGAFYLTRGYAAPEACTEDPTVSIASDLYTVGRTLAILALNFDWGGAMEYNFPSPDEEPRFAKYECFYRFLLRACHQDPDQRFQSADEMGDQLLGVLNEIVAVDAEEQSPVTSSHFAADVLKETGRPTYKSIPDLKIDQDDSARSLVETALALTSAHEQIDLYRQAIQQFPKSAEARLRLAGLYTDLRKFQEAETLIAECVAKDPFDYRNVWMRGRLLLAQQKHGYDDGAFGCFDAVFSEVPGELAPKLALAIAAELQGDTERAIRYYELVSGVDRNYVTAAFGLGRCLAGRGETEASADAYERVPASSISYLPALMAKVRTLMASNPNTDSFKVIAATLERIPANSLEVGKLRAEVLLRAVEQLQNGYLTINAPFKIAGTTVALAALREALSDQFAVCATHAEYLPELKSRVLQALESAPTVQTFDMLSLQLAKVPANTFDMHVLRSDVLIEAVTRVASGNLKPATIKLLGAEFAEIPLRNLLEAELRSCAQFAIRDEDKFMYVNLANEFKNRKKFSWL